MNLRVVQNLLTGGLDEYFQRTNASSGTALDFIADALGSTLAVTNSGGGIDTSYKYDPFGNVSVTGSNDNPYQFTGRENDNTGVYFYRGRYYAPSTQKFISQDPIGFAGGSPNLYAYVDDSPTYMIDPYGTRGWFVCVVVCSVVGGSVGGLTGCPVAGIGAGIACGIICHSIFNPPPGPTHPPPRPWPTPIPFPTPLSTTPSIPGPAT